MSLLAIDPGTTESGWVLLREGRVAESGVSDNDTLLENMLFDCGDGDVGCAIEMIASYGMPVGREVFETCVWIGRFSERWHSHTGNLPALVYRRDVKLHLCGTAKAKDANVRQALIDLLGPQGTKREPGATYGVRSHAWAALAVGVTHLGLQRN